MSRTKGPFIQVEIAAMNLYPRVAMIAKIGIEFVHMGFNELWRHCFWAKVDRIPVGMIAGFFPASDHLIEALVICKFAELVDNDTMLRIRGTDRYARDSETKADAGRKGGKVTASKAVRVNGRFAKQAPVSQSDDQAEHQADTKQGNEPTAPSSASQTKQTPSSESSRTPSGPHATVSPSRAVSNCTVTGKSPVSPPSRTPSSPSSDQSAHQAIEERRSSLSLSENKGESSASGRATPPPVDLSAEKPHGLAKPAPEWPSHECEVAGLAWYAKLREERPLGHAWTIDDAKRVAMEFPEVFPEAAVEMAEQSKPWVGWKTDLIAWLRRECGFVEAKRKDQARAAKKRSDVGPGDRYTPRFRPEPGAPAPVYEPVKPKSYPEPQGRITPSAEWEATWAAARVAVANLLDIGDDEFYLAPLTPLGVSEAGELVLAADSPETRERVVGQVWEGFIAPAVEKALKARKQPPGELRITIRERASARGAA